MLMTPHAVGRMDLREVRELTTWWIEHPPAVEIAQMRLVRRSGSQPNRPSLTADPHQGDRIVRPRTVDEYQQFPIPLGPPKKARKLIRFPINIPGDSGYVDKTPAWIDKLRTA